MKTKTHFAFRVDVWDAAGDSIVSAVTKVRSNWHVRYACTGDASLTEEVRLHLDEKTGQLIMNSKVKMK
jgi:hypothetical protein